MNKKKKKKKKEKRMEKYNRIGISLKSGQGAWKNVW